VPLELDRRIFTPIARCSPKWDEAYNRRSSVERVNSGIDKLLCFERHSIRGQRKMKVRVGLGLAVMLAMALGRIQAGQPEQIEGCDLARLPGRLSGAPTRATRSDGAAEAEVCRDFEHLRDIVPWHRRLALGEAPGGRRRGGGGRRRGGGGRRRARRRLQRKWLGRGHPVSRDRMDHEVAS
jgi:hypothetical protein